MSSSACCSGWLTLSPPSSCAFADSLRDVEDERAVIGELFGGRLPPQCGDGNRELAKGVFTHLLDRPGSLTPWPLRHDRVQELVCAV